jgi:hypothetical protein
VLPPSLVTATRHDIAEFFSRAGRLWGAVLLLAGSMTKLVRKSVRTTIHETPSGWKSAEGW